MFNLTVILIIIVIIIAVLLIRSTESFGPGRTCEALDSIPQNMVFVPCEGDYALCYYAKCKLNADGTADCGCQEFNGTSFVDVNNIIPPDVKEATKGSCPYGLVSCPYMNEAPVCDYVNQNTGLISTFSSGDPTYEALSSQGRKFIFEGVRSCPAGPYANCMTAQCKREVAFDGSPVTCRCPVGYDKHTIAKGVGSCQQEDSIWSGVPE